MSSGSQKRTRSERVAALELPPGLVERTLGVSAAAATCCCGSGCALLAIVGLWAVTARLGFRSFSYRDVTRRRATSWPRSPFSKADPDGHASAKAIGGQQGQLRLRAGQRAAGAIAGRTAKPRGDRRRRQDAGRARQEGVAGVLSGRRLPERRPLDARGARSSSFQRVSRRAGRRPKRCRSSNKRVAEALAPFEQRGLMEKLPQEHNEGTSRKSSCMPKGQPGPAASRSKSATC